MALRLADDDDRLAVALEAEEVARSLDLLGPAGEQPGLVEHPLALEFELHGIRVRVAAHLARPVVGDVLDRGAEAHRHLPLVGQSGWNVHHAGGLLIRLQNSCYV